MATQQQGTPTAVIAKLFNLTTRRVNQLANEGIINRIGDNRYDLADTVQRYVRYLQERGNKDTDTLESEARIAKFRADKLELELNHLRNNMIPIGLATDAWSKIIEIIRAAIINLPRKAAPIVAGTTSAPEAEKLIRELCYDILRELSNPDLGEIVKLENDKKREANAKRRKL